MCDEHGHDKPNTGPQRRYRFCILCHVSVSERLMDINLNGNFFRECQRKVERECSCSILLSLVDRLAGVSNSICYGEWFDRRSAYQFFAMIYKTI